MNTPQPVSNKRSALSILSVVLAIVLPPIGLVTSILALRESKRRASKGKAIAIFGIVWGAIFTLPFIFFAWLFISFGGLKKNEAQTNLKPIMSKIEQLGGQKICKNGDSGYGIDNTKPWYQVYYQIPNSPDLTENIIDMARQQGYELKENTAYVNQLKGLDQSGRIYSVNGRDEYSPQSNYLIAQKGDESLEVVINRNSSVGLRCDSGTYGREQTPGKNSPITSISLRLPSTRN